MDLGPQNQADPGVDGLGRRLLVVTKGPQANARGPGVALVVVKVADEGKVRTAALGCGNVGHQQVHHAAPLCLGRPDRVAQRNFSHGAYPVAIVEMVVVHLLDAEILLRVARHGAQCLVVVEIGFGVVAGKPLLYATFEQIEQFVAALQVALLLHHIHQFGDALQPFALPVGAGADFEHHAPGAALVVLDQLAQLSAARVVAHAGPKGHKAVVGLRGLEPAARKQANFSAQGIKARPELRLDRRVFEPLVWVQAQQGVCLRAFHYAGAGLKGVGDLAAGLVKLPVHPRVLQKGVGVLGEQGQGLRAGVGQGGGGEIGLSFGQASDPLGAANGLPAHAGRAKQGIGLAFDVQGKHAGVCAVAACRGRRQLQAKVAPRQLEVGVGAAMGYGGRHLVGSLAPGDVDVPVAGLCQLGLARSEGGGRNQQRVGMGVVDFHVPPLGGHHHFAGQGELQAGVGGLHGERVGEQDLGLGAKHQGRVPLVGGRGLLQHGGGAKRRCGHRLVTPLGGKHIGASTELDRLR